MEIIRKLKEGTYSDLDPEERHYFFTLIRGVITHNRELDGLRYELRKFNLGLLNGYPVLLRLSEKINFRIVQAVNEANYLSLKKYQGKRNFGIKEKISEIEAAVKYRESLTNNAFMVGIEFEHEAVPLDIRADFFIQTDLLEYIKEDENQIRLPLMNDLQLVANIIENNPENDENHVNREMIDRRR